MAALFADAPAWILESRRIAERCAFTLADLGYRFPDFPLPPGDLPDLRAQGTLFQDVAAVSVVGCLPLAGDGNEPEQVSVAAASTDLLTLLGARTAVGRTFVESDGAVLPPPANLPTGAAVPPPPATALLSYGFWQRRYGGDPGVVGRTIQLGGGSSQVVGVLAPDFELLLPPDLRGSALRTCIRRSASTGRPRHASTSSCGTSRGCGPASPSPRRKRR